MVIHKKSKTREERTECGRYIPDLLSAVMMKWDYVDCKECLKNKVGII